MLTAPSAPLVSQLEQLVLSLGGFAGPRTLWRDPYGRLWHTAPGEAPAHASWRALGSFVQPTLSHLLTVLAEPAAEPARRAA
ncbi:MAG: hypothetical protein IPH07_22850 [Deltaproteobacteria bacterium]|jgi:hypothetical protein|nr:hypothetical protein [Deltaproteobacteria bacterium]MBK8240816.1 hypothetical protein [Deltaproteobacteria bacterium]MBK8714181.1 hypothetical protein [Deltaproteobacteria bacterium]MBP7291648.1 hypothetical protein [Nannocystaceae bacterium]